MFVLYTPKFNDQYPTMIFQNVYFRVHVNFWLILYRFAKVASKLVQNRGRVKRLKKYLQFAVFTPLLPPLNLFFRNVAYVEWNRIPFEFGKRSVRSRDIKGGLKQPPPLPLRRVARSLPLIGLDLDINMLFHVTITYKHYI